jgi:hypothetical protein
VDPFSRANAGPSAEEQEQPGGPDHRPFYSGGRIKAVTISHDSEMVVAIGDDQAQSLGLWAVDVDKDGDGCCGEPALLARGSAGCLEIYDCTWNSFSTNAPGETDFVTHGRRHMQFWFYEDEEPEGQGDHSEMALKGRLSSVSAKWGGHRAPNQVENSNHMWYQKHY